MNNIIFDIETAPLDEGLLLASAPAFDPASVKVGNIKDPELIAQKVAKAKEKHREDILSSAALDPLTGWVCAIGFKFEDGWQAIYNKDCTKEADLLRQFWDIYKRHNNGQSATRFIGHNIFEFDLPFLIARSWVNFVEVPHNVVSFGRSKYPSFDPCFIDTRAVWLMGRKQGGSSLDSVAKCLTGLGKNGEGSEFYQTLLTDSEKAIKYLENDLTLTERVAWKMGLTKVHT